MRSSIDRKLPDLGRVEGHMYGIADALAGAPVKQFPTKFA